MGVPLPDESFLAQWQGPIVIVRVVTAATGTNGAPPVTPVEILEALRGDVALGSAQAEWLPWSEGSFYSMREGGIAGLQRWQAEPLHAPSAGTRLIVLVQMHSPGRLSICDRCRFDDTDERRGFVRAATA